MARLKVFTIISNSCAEIEKIEEAICEECKYALFKIIKSSSELPKLNWGSSSMIILTPSSQDIIPLSFFSNEEDFDRKMPVLCLIGDNPVTELNNFFSEQSVLQNISVGSEELREGLKSLKQKGIKVIGSYLSDSKELFQEMEGRIIGISDGQRRQAQ